MTHIVTSKPNKSWLVGYQAWKDAQAHIQVSRAVRVCGVEGLEEGHGPWQG